MTPNVHISLMLAVQDAPAAVDWYKRALGATELWNLGGVAGLSIAGAPVFVASRRTTAGTPRPQPAPEPCESRSSPTTPTDSSNVPWQPARTAASTRSATIRRHGAFTGKEASSTRSATCGSSGTSLPCNGFLAS
jgi:catechol 2,3-dioxygenase-like lactoylglutathione lyase family enzyme